MLPVSGHFIEEFNMQEQSRFLKDKDGAIYDSVTSLTWMGNDSRLDLEKNITWHEAQQYADETNKKKNAGHGDWRLPTIHEALSLYDEKKLNKDCGRRQLYMDQPYPGRKGRPNSFLSQRLSLLVRKKRPNHLPRRSTGEKGMITGCYLSYILSGRLILGTVCPHRIEESSCLENL